MIIVGKVELSEIKIKTAKIISNADGMSNEIMKKSPFASNMRAKIKMILEGII